MNHLTGRFLSLVALLAATSISWGFVIITRPCPSSSSPFHPGRCRLLVRRRDGPFSFFRKDGPAEEPGKQGGKTTGANAEKKASSVRSGFNNLGSPPPSAAKKVGGTISGGNKGGPTGGKTPPPPVRASTSSEGGPVASITSAFAAITEKLQTPLKVWPLLDKLAYLIVGFLGGAGTGVIFLLSPSGNLPESIAQPITLFENILLEIDRGYVERVDDKKLFETAVESMLNSLDPYTEFEGEQLAKDMRESVSGRYGGVGLVIAGSKISQPEAVSTPAPPAAAGNTIDAATALPIDQSSESQPLSPDGGGAKDAVPVTKRQGGSKEAADGASRGAGTGITVVSAFEGYAFDAGMRVGDRLIAVDDIPVTSKSVDQVRDLLRGPPETLVKVAFERPGVPSSEGGIELTLTRRLVRVPDVKLTTFLGPPDDGIGYVQLQGFSQGAPNELRLSLELLRLRAPNGVKGLILDLRNNPGGLLSSAVDVASLLVPNESEIVSAKGRNFPAVSYSSSIAPMRDNNVPLAVLVNSGTASAAEIVSGAVQDLDSGVIVGSDRTFGKGLVQNVETLPYNTALKYTVAKYYTPSGRCIQSVRYQPPEGKTKVKELLRESRSGGGYEASNIPDNERKEFHTRNGRVVRDGGGIEADVKVAAPTASVLEVTLLQQGAFFDYAGEWAKQHRYNGEGIHKSDHFINDQVYEDFKKFIYNQVDKGALKLDLLFTGSLEPLEEAIKETEYKQAKTDLANLRKAIRSEVDAEFASKREQISEQIQEAILARYLPESMLRRIALERDPQVKVALETIKDKGKYSSILREPGTAYAGTTGAPTTTIKGDRLASSSTTITNEEDEEKEDETKRRENLDKASKKIKASSSSFTYPISLL